MPRSLVTGATGFVGSNLVAYLRQLGWDVSCLVRDPSRGAALEQLGADLRQGELSNEESLRSAVAGADYVFHVAKAFKDGFDRDFDGSVDVAGGEGDLGAHFPSSDPALAGIASGEILERVMARVRSAGLRVANLDATLIAERPRLASHQPKIRASLADLLGVAAEAVNVKVTSTDGLGAVGRGEGIAAQAVVLLGAAPEEE